MKDFVDKNLVFNEKCDVFSYAIVLWELITHRVPYEDRSADEIRAGVLAGSRLSIVFDSTDRDLHCIAPCRERLQTLVQACWCQDSTKRPSFTDIVNEVVGIRALMSGGVGASGAATAAAAAATAAAACSAGPGAAAAADSSCSAAAASPALSLSASVLSNVARAGVEGYASQLSSGKSVNGGGGGGGEEEEEEEGELSSPVSVSAASIMEGNDRKGMTHTLALKSMKTEMCT